MDEKAVVKIGPDGEAVGCAKGLTEGCGYKAGAKICGKCGAMAVQIKKPMPVADDEEMVDDGEYTDDVEKMGMGVDPMKLRKRNRMRRMDTMGVKSAEFDADAFVCGFDRKMYPGQAQPCATCPGGCKAEGSMPSLLEIEGAAEAMFAGKVLDSGYADNFDLFVVDVERKDGRPVEAIFDGTTGECVGWHLLNEDVIGEKSAEDDDTVISFEEAAEIAVKSLDGVVVSVDADMVEGVDAYAVEVQGADGSSYDVYVGLDGEILLVDEFTAEEAADIDAELAEVAMKAAYGEDEREAMAKEGSALDDGSFPIENTDDLRNAIMAFGRAKDKAKAKAHIMKRAEELDALDMIPESWSEDDDEDDDEDMAEAETGEKAEVDAQDMAFLASLIEFELLATDETLGDH